MDRISVAWAAGLFEGEGYVGASVGLRIRLGMTDEDVVRRFAGIVGVGKVKKRNRTASIQSHWKDQWVWYANGLEDTQAVVAMFWPWLGQRRRKQFRDAMAEWLGRPRQRGIRCSNNADPEFKAERIRRAAREYQARKRAEQREAGCK